MKQTSISHETILDSDEDRLLIVLQNLAEMLLKNEQPKEPHSKSPELLSTDHIIEMNDWSPSLVYNRIKCKNYRSIDNRKVTHHYLKSEAKFRIKRNVP